MKMKYLTVKKSMKMKFSADKIYYDFSRENSKNSTYPFFLSNFDASCFFYCNSSHANGQCLCLLHFSERHFLRLI